MVSPPPNLHTILRTSPRAAAAAAAVLLLAAATAFATLVGNFATLAPMAGSATAATASPPENAAGISPAADATDRTAPDAFGIAFAARAARFAWPTPLPVSAATPWENFSQATASGDPASGLFGLHRNGGNKFHEGVDIRPAARDRRGEPTDTVRAALPGAIAHFTATPNGPYGRYIVLQHAEPGLRYYTLYAHLASVSPALRHGARVEAGDALGVMGRSDEGRGFPRERAHLHFEIGVRLSPSFGAWYSRQREFGVPNRQSVWNGINLAGIDPLPFLRQGLASGAAPRLFDHLRAEPVALAVHVATARVPAFVRENPALLTAPIPQNLAGWKIEFAWHGLPLRWTPLETPPAAAGIAASMERGRPVRSDSVAAGENNGANVRAETAAITPASGEFAPGVFVFNPGRVITGVASPAYLQLSADSVLVQKSFRRGMLEKPVARAKPVTRAKSPPSPARPSPTTTPSAPGPTLLRNLGILFE